MYALQSGIRYVDEGMQRGARSEGKRKYVRGVDYRQGVASACEDGALSGLRSEGRI